MGSNTTVNRFIGKNKSHIEKKLNIGFDAWRGKEKSHNVNHVLAVALPFVVCSCSTIVLDLIPPTGCIGVL